MNPHFLFNAINSIYVLIRKDPDLAEHTLARFSEMLRYQLYDCATDFIPIEKEIAYLENYMRLEQLRKGSMLTLDYCTEETVRHFSVAPLLLMPLVENAFKFVSSFTDRDNKVCIRLFFNDGRFLFEIGNTVDEFGPLSRPGNPPEQTGAAASGIGLENIRRRLELLYPMRHTLAIDAGREYYNVSLKLQLT
jgi:LytS/YehU family sensor histidine kinase